MLTEALPNLHAGAIDSDIGHRNHLSRARTWFHEALCALRGHDLMFHIDPGRRICLRCFTCGHETPGWRTK